MSDENSRNFFIQVLTTGYSTSALQAPTSYDVIANPTRLDISA